MYKLYGFKKLMKMYKTKVFLKLLIHSAFIFHHSFRYVTFDIILCITDPSINKLNFIRMFFTV